ncbi:MAG: LppX_LprAFG lipoprotein [Actinomycetota bacterium]|nr:LppX_LprAFG lipoprotein [Actinomycetota bacterium]
MLTRGTAVAMAVLVAVVSACGSSANLSSAQAKNLLDQGKAAIDNSQAFHFTLTTAGVPQGSGTTIVGGAGDLARPDKLVGSFTVSVGGLQAAVKAAAGGGKFYAQLPFQKTYTATDPASFGVANPAQLISPSGGLSSILSDTTQAVSGGQTRVNGELLDVVSGSVPGSDITVLPDKDPSRPVAVKALINPSNHQVRQVMLTGPIETTAASASFTVTLTGYGEHVPLAIPG